MIGKRPHGIINARTLVIAILGILFISFVSYQDPGNNYDWPVYGGGKERLQYSALDQINPANVKDLEVAWIYNTKDSDKSSQIQANPLIVDGVLYGVTAQLKLFAADAANGNEKWVFNPADSILVDNSGRNNYGINACRGLALYKKDNGEHLLFYTVGPSLFCISSKTGKPVKTFGRNGRIILEEGLDPKRNLKHLRITSTTPGIIFKNLLIVGTSLSEEEEAAPGHIRAFDVHTGAMKWLFRTIPAPGETGFDSWEDPNAYKFVGGANAWGGLTLDEKRGMVFASTGTTNPDFYGGKRKGDNLFGNSVLALDAATGKYRWHFQTIHHDLWDWDLPTSPVLVTVRKDRKKVDAVVQVTKHGFIFMLDRETGTPVYPVNEKAVPTDSDLTGEQPSPTQPFPTVIPAFARQSFTEADLNPLVPDSSKADLKQRFLSYKRGPMFTTPSKQGTLVLPGLTGGAEWGGPSFDPQSGILYINSTEMPWIITMVDAKDKAVPASNQTNLEAGKTLFTRNCAGCHGADRKGSGAFPALLDLEKRYDEAGFKELVSSGRRMMPGFKNLSEADKTAIASYLLNITSKQGKKFVQEARVRDPFYNTPYRLGGIKQFLTKEGHPGIAPPWGTLNAIDLNKGKILWKKPLGDVPEFKAKGITTGTENYGGSVVTAGGLVFIAATKDEKFRAFDKKTGKILFETQLPAGGYATPSVYSVNGKQYIVIACGGGKLQTKSGDSYVAFSLPSK